jgi:hypothetical protein
MHTTPKSVAPSVRYIVSDNNARETADTIQEAVDIVEEWYHWVDGAPAFPSDNVEEEITTIDQLREFIDRWQQQIAELQGFDAVSGHGNYNVSPADRMGLCLKVTAETVPGQYVYATDGDSGTITATDFDDAKRQLVEMFTEEILADGGSGWVDDVDGTRYRVE